MFSCVLNTFILLLSSVIYGKLQKQTCEMTILQNGLRVVTCATEKTASQKVSFNVALAVRVGHSSNIYPGIAHITEHCIGGAPEFEKAIPQSNANTANDSTCYYFSCGGKHLISNLRHLADIFINPNLKESSVQKEIVPVDVEWHHVMYSEHRICATISSLFMSPQNPLYTFRHGNKATYEAIEKYTGRKLVDIVREFYQTNYSSDKMTLVIEGPVDSLEGLRNEISDAFSKIPFIPTTAKDLNYKLYSDYLENNLLVAATESDPFVSFQWIVNVTRSKVDTPEMVPFVDIIENTLSCDISIGASWIDDEHLEIFCMCDTVDYKSQSSLNKKLDSIKKDLMDIQPRQLFSIMSSVDFSHRVARTSHFMDDAAVFRVKVDGKAPLHPQQYKAIRSIASQLNLRNTQIIGFSHVLNDDIPSSVEPHTQTKYQWHPKFLGESTFTFNFAYKMLADYYVENIRRSFKHPEWSLFEELPKTEQTAFGDSNDGKLCKFESSDEWNVQQVFSNFLYPNVVKINIVFNYDGESVKFKYIRNSYLKFLRLDQLKSADLTLVANKEEMIKISVLAKYSYETVFGRLTEFYFLALKEYLGKFYPQITCIENADLERLTIYFPKTMSSKDIADYLYLRKNTPDNNDFFSNVESKIIKFSRELLFRTILLTRQYATLFSPHQPYMLDYFVDPIMTNFNLDKFKSVINKKNIKVITAEHSEEINSFLGDGGINMFQPVLPGNPVIYCPKPFAHSLNHVSVVYLLSKDKSFPLLSEHINISKMGELFNSLFSQIYHQRIRYEEELGYSPYIFFYEASVTFDASSRQSPATILAAIQKFVNDIPSILNTLDDEFIQKYLKKISVINVAPIESIKEELKMYLVKHMDPVSPYARFTVIEFWKDDGNETHSERLNHLDSQRSKGYYVFERLEEYPSAAEIPKINEMDVAELISLKASLGL